MADSPLRSPRPSRAEGEPKPKKISVGELSTRLELAFGLVPLPVEMWGKICKVLLPEEYGDGGRAVSPMTHLPHSLSRIDAYIERASKRMEVCHPKDKDFADSEGVLPEYDFDRPSGTLAPKRLHGEAVGYEKQNLSGEGRAELPECSDRLIRDGGEAKRTRREKDDGRAAVEMLRKVLSHEIDGKSLGQTFPGRLRRAREQKNWSLKRVAKKTGLSFGFLAKVERGEKRPSYATLKAIAHLYGGSNLTAADLLLSPWPD